MLNEFDTWLLVCGISILGSVLMAYFESVPSILLFGFVALIAALRILVIVLEEINGN